MSNKVAATNQQLGGNAITRYMLTEEMVSLAVVGVAQTRREGLKMLEGLRRDWARKQLPRLKGREAGKSGHLRGARLEGGKKAARFKHAKAF